MIEAGLVCGGAGRVVCGDVLIDCDEVEVAQRADAVWPERPVFRVEHDVLDAGVRLVGDGEEDALLARLRRDVDGVAVIAVE